MPSAFIFLQRHTCSERLQLVPLHVALSGTYLSCSREKRSHCGVNCTDVCMCSRVLRCVHARFMCSDLSFKGNDCVCVLFV